MTNLPRPRIGSRVAHRWHINALIDAGDSHDRCKAIATDISVSGLRLRSLDALSVGQNVWVELPGIDALQITVQWVDDLVAGCSFVEPLGQEVLEHVLKTAEVSVFDIVERRKFPRPSAC